MPDVQVEVAYFRLTGPPQAKTDQSEIVLEVGPDDISNADTISVFET